MYPLTGPPLEPGGPEGPLGPGSPCTQVTQNILISKIKCKGSVSSVCAVFYLLPTWSSGSQWTNRTWSSLFTADKAEFSSVKFYRNQRRKHATCCGAPELCTTASESLCREKSAHLTHPCAVISWRTLRSFLTNGTLLQIQSIISRH